MQLNVHGTVWGTRNAQHIRSHNESAQAQRCPLAFLEMKVGSLSSAAARRFTMSLKLHRVGSSSNGQGQPFSAARHSLLGAAGPGR